MVAQKFSWKFVSAQGRRLYQWRAPRKKEDLLIFLSHILYKWKGKIENLLSILVS